MHLFPLSTILADFLDTLILETMSQGYGGTSYADAVASLQVSLSSLENSVNTLGEAVTDYPRLGSVLKTVRVGTL